jgi:SecD/SecF fusion protein
MSVVMSLAGRTNLRMGLAIAIVIVLHATRSLCAEEPGRLEFRILADRRHDPEAVEKAKAADSFEHPPAGYRWVRFGQVVTGTVPKVEEGRLDVPAAHWRDDEFADRKVWMKCQGGIRGAEWQELTITKNGAHMLQFGDFPDDLHLRSITSYQIDLTPRPLGDLQPADGAIIRDFPEAHGLVLRAVLVRLDRHNLGERDLAGIHPDSDDRGFPTVAIQFTGAGGRKLRALTTEHLPEREGGFFYRLGIILDGRLLSAPEIHGAVGSDSGAVGVIELGPDAPARDADRITKLLRTSSRRAASRPD